MRLGKEHWLGLDNIYKLTNRKNVMTQLKIILEYKSGQKHIVTYDDFQLKDQVMFTFTHMIMNLYIPFWFQTNYRLHLGQKRGVNIGNFRYSNNMAFTTIDHDQDNHNSANCAIHIGGKGSDYWAPVLWMTSALFMVTTEVPAGVSWTSKEPKKQRIFNLI